MTWGAWSSLEERRTLCSKSARKSTETFARDMDIEDWLCKFLEIKTRRINQVNPIVLMKITNAFENGKIKKKRKKEQTKQTNKRRILS